MTQKGGNKGFTLIELMVVVAIVGILAAIAVPAFTEQMRKSRRTVCQTELQSRQLAMERFRANNPTYVGAPVAEDNTQDHYNFPAVSGTAAAAYTLTCNAKGAQADDTTCAAMTITLTAGSATPVKAPAACW